MESKQKQLAVSKKKQNYCEDCMRQDGIVNNEIEGTAVCKYCGIVKEYHVIDETSEWRNFGNDGSGKSDGGRSSGDRTGANCNLDMDNYGMDSMITGGAEGEKFNRLARRQLTAHDRNLKLAMVSLQHYAGMLNLSKKVQGMVRQLFSNSEKKGALKGKPLEAKLGAMIYMCCKIAYCPKNLREIVQVSGCKRKDITRCYRVITEYLPKQDIKTNLAETVSTLCNRTGVSSLVEEAARSCVQMVCDKELLVGRNPNTIAGSCLYLIARMSATPLEFREVADAAQLAETTIRDNFKRLFPYHKEIVPKWYCSYELKPLEE